MSSSELWNMCVEKVWNSPVCPDWASHDSLGWPYQIMDMGFKLVCCPWPSELIIVAEDVKGLFVACGSR